MTAHVHTLNKPQRFALITISDSRTVENDESGRIMLDLTQSAGHSVVFRQIVRDEPVTIKGLLKDLIGKADVVCLSGGTGISRRDRTFEAVSELLEKTLSGFGELFRALSYDEIGAAAMLSRAIGGLYRGMVVFAMPGSPHAVRLAMKNLILPQATHLAGELRKQ